MNVKKLIALVTICAAALGSAGTFITASADEGLNIPESLTAELTLDSVTDYSVADGQVAFASENTIYIYSINESESTGYDYAGGELTTYVHSSDIVALEHKTLTYSDETYLDGWLFSDESSVFFYTDGEVISATYASLSEYISNSLSVPDTVLVELLDFNTFTEYDSETLQPDGYFVLYVYEYYYNIMYDTLYIYHMTASTDDEKTIRLTDGVYSNLKYIDGCYYVLKDNTLCTISRGELSEMSFSYEQDELSVQIATNGTAQALGASGEVQTAAVSSGAYLIRVDEDELNGENFSVLGLSYADGSESAQVLYMPDGGNAALIAVGTRTYLTLKSNLTISAYSVSAADSQNYYILDGATVYSVPFENDNTVLAVLDKDSAITVTGYVTGEAFGYDYYRVEYTSDGETISGYVIAAMLSPYTFANDSGSSSLLENEASDENEIITMVLVMVIVLLVLIAIGYITFVATSDRRRRRRRR